MLVKSSLQSARCSVYAAVVLAVVSVPATAQVEAWVRRYNGPGNSHDQGQAMAVDAAGNVYVTGSSDGSGTSADYATAKYSPLGTQEWVIRYNGPDSGEDRARAIALDSGGDIYVTGGSAVSGGTMDYVTIRYNAAGTQQWLARYNGSANNNDDAYDIALDSTGNVYVTGLSYVGSSHYDFTTVKYNTTGTLLWVTNYNLPGNSADQPYAIAVDAAGNVCVTGSGWGGSPTANDWATVKYNTTGTRQWDRVYSGPGANDDEGRDIAVDASNNVYVAGYTWNGSGTVFDFATIKYSPTGTQLWLRTYDGPANSDDRARALVLDSLGDVFVLGSSQGSGTGDDFTTIKYSAAGTQQWLSRYNSPTNATEQAEKIALDADGNVYVAGYSNGFGAGPDFATVKYDPTGVQQWDLQYDADNGSDFVRGIAIDPDGSVIVAGYSMWIATANDYTTIKYYQCDSTAADCNSNGVLDQCDIAFGTGDDCNTNSQIDECETGSGDADDCDSNSVPDECDPDCDASSIPDVCEIAAGTSDDCNLNGVPDICESGGGTYTWDGPHGGSFTHPSNWNPDGVPGAGAQAILSNATGTDNRAVLSAPGATGMCSLTVEASGSGAQILQINSGSTLSANDGTTIGAGGHVLLQGGELTGGLVANESNTLSGYGVISADVLNLGLIEGIPGVSTVLLLSGGSLDNQPGAALRIRSGSLVIVRATSVNQSGTLEARSLAGVLFDSALTNAPGAEVSLLNGTLAANGVFNSDAADITGFGTIDADLDNDGRLTVIADMQILGNLDNEGTVTIQSGLFTVTGNVTGSGTIIGGFGGRDGDSSGLTIHGDFLPSVSDWRQLDLTDSTLQLDGDPADGPQRLEVMAPDRGVSVTLPDATLCSIGTLRIGPSATVVRLLDQYDNKGVGSAVRRMREVLCVRHLILEPGVTLDLAGLRLYCETVSPTDSLAAGGSVTVIDSVGGGGLIQLHRHQSQ